MRIFMIVFLAIFLVISVHAGTYHQDDQSHLVVITAFDTTGNHVTGETFRLTVRSRDNVNYFDFDDSVWGTFGSATTPHVTMNEDADGGFYWYTFTPDQATLVSGDYVFIVSNESTGVFSQSTVEVINFDQIGELIKIHR